MIPLSICRKKWLKRLIKVTHYVGIALIHLLRIASDLISKKNGIMDSVRSNIYDWLDRRNFIRRLRTLQLVKEVKYSEKVRE